MQISQEHYYLALDVLAGEPHAHKVLADLLEERGERGLAQWARSRKESSRKRLDLVLALIPAQVGVPLACDCVEHALGRHAHRYRSAAAILEPLAAVRSWTETADSLKGLRRVCSRLDQVTFYDVCGPPGGRQPWPLGLACRALAEAARAAAEAATSGEIGPWQVRFHEDRARVHVRHAARHSREEAGWRLDESPPPNWLRTWGAPHVPQVAHDPAGRAAELHWQVEQTKQILEDLIRGA